MDLVRLYFIDEKSDMYSPQFIIMLILWIFCFFWVLLSYFAISTNLKTFKKMDKFSCHQIDPKYYPVARTDYHQWNKTRILLGSFTLFPLRFFLLGNFLVGALLFALFINFSKGMIKSALITLMFKYYNTYGKLMNSLAIDIKDQFTDYKIRSPIIISNHSSWFDTFYLTLRFSPVSYVAKDEIKNWPVIGPISQAMSCIFVKRQSQQARASTTSLIKQRVEDIANNVQGQYPLIIYPEGTTSNNRVLLTFKNGAFENLSEITALCLRYECENFNAGEDQLSQLEHIPLMLSQRVRLIVHKLVFSPKQNETILQYRDRIRQEMAKVVGFQVVECGYRDRVSLQKIRKQKENQKIA